MAQRKKRRVPTTPVAALADQQGCHPSGHRGHSRRRKKPPRVMRMLDKITSSPLLCHAASSLSTTRYGDEDACTITASQPRPGEEAASALSLSLSLSFGARRAGGRCEEDFSINPPLPNFWVGVGGDRVGGGKRRKTRTRAPNESELRLLVEAPFFYFLPRRLLLLEDGDCGGGGGGGGEGEAPPVPLCPAHARLPRACARSRLLPLERSIARPRAGQSFFFFLFFFLFFARCYFFSCRLWCRRCT